MIVRNYERGAEAELWHLFHHTIHDVNSQHYTRAQLEAWSPSNYDRAFWRQKMQSLAPFVAEEDGEIFGYADLQSSGIIEHFFVHQKRQRKGVGTLLMREIECRAKSLGLSELEAHVSITARRFFESFGFSVVAEQEVEVRGETLSNFVMRRKL